MSHASGVFCNHAIGPRILHPSGVWGCGGAIPGLLVALSISLWNGVGRSPVAAFIPFDAFLFDGSTLDGTPYLLATPTLFDPINESDNAVGFSVGLAPNSSLFAASNIGGYGVFTAYDRQGGELYSATTRAGANDYFNIGPHKTLIKDRSRAGFFVATAGYFVSAGIPGGTINSANVWETSADGSLPGFGTGPALTFSDPCTGAIDYPSSSSWARLVVTNRDSIPAGSGNVGNWVLIDADDGSTGWVHFDSRTAPPWNGYTVWTGAAVSAAERSFWLVGGGSAIGEWSFTAGGVSGIGFTRVIAPDLPADMGISGATFAECRRWDDPETGTRYLFVNGQYDDTIYPRYKWVVWKINLDTNALVDHRQYTARASSPLGRPARITLDSSGRVWVTYRGDDPIGTSTQAVVEIFSNDLATSLGRVTFESEDGPQYLARDLEVDF